MERVAASRAAASTEMFGREGPEMLRGAARAAGREDVLQSQARAYAASERAVKKAWRRLVRTWRREEGVGSGCYLGSTQRRGWRFQSEAGAVMKGTGVR